MTSPSVSRQAEGRVARMLSTMPMFRKWQHQPLDPCLQRLLNELDEQTLMSLAACALLRLENLSKDHTAAA
ncbi:MAG: hypothetical protein IT445_05100 [Phycisphaeraceae bacterium]|nr:hypothetical protein [Phycisphaeraceae bacterium]